MYKTVRQGENSLQYHILPQDDVAAGHVMKRRRSTRHRTAFILVITLILGCAIVAAAVLIPVLLTGGSPRALPARYQTFAVAASSVNMKAHGKYTLQGTQYIALLPVKDPLGHFNAYQLKPSLLGLAATTSTSTSTTTSTTTTTTTGPPPPTEVDRIPDLLGVRTENNDPYRPRSGPPEPHRGELRPRWIPEPYMPWMEHKGGALALSIGVALVMLLATATLGLCLFLRRRAFNARRDVERDKGNLLGEVCDED